MITSNHNSQAVPVFGVPCSALQGGKLLPPGWELEPADVTG